MPIINPAPQPKSTNRNLRRQRRRWDDADTQALSLGCVGCADREICGGLHKKQSHYSCLDDCCNTPETCDSVCPRSHKRFIERVREVNGFELTNIGRTDPRPAKALPAYVPLIYHRNRREGFLGTPVVALPLHKFYSRRSGLLRYMSRRSIEEAFRIDKKTRILLIGSGRDRPIEYWWGLSHYRHHIVTGLRALDVELVTSPNYSLFTDEPRYTDMYNIKRIGIAWQEFVACNLSSALHLNARTKRDYERFTEFIRERPEVTEVAFEFGTGANWPQRRDFHIRHLATLPREVGRPLRLIMIGGLPAISSLASAYADLIYVDTSAFMNALHRQRLYIDSDGVMKKSPETTQIGEPVDALLGSNIECMRTHVEGLISGSRSTGSGDGTVPMPKILES